MQTHVLQEPACLALPTPTICSLMTFPSSSTVRIFCVAGKNRAIQNHHQLLNQKGLRHNSSQALTKSTPIVLM